MQAVTAYLELYSNHCRKEAPPSMGELIVKYQLDADELKVKDLIAARDFLAQRLGVPEYLLQVLSWGKGSVVITYWIERDMLPLAELALHHDDVIAELTEHCVEAIYFGNPSFHPGHVSSRGMVHSCQILNCIFRYPLLLPCRWTNHCKVCNVRETLCALSFMCSTIYKVLEPVV